MKTRFALIAALTLASSSALAQSAFVPFTVQESDVAQLQQYFRFNTPPAYSEPVIQWIAGMEQKAQAAAAAKKPPVPPTPQAKAPEAHK